MFRLFKTEQQGKAMPIMQSKWNRLSDLTSGEVRDLCCAWAYYSGKIEGNTYTYVETEALLKDGITSEKRYEDAKMLKNLYNAFNSELEYIKRQGKQETIDERLLFRLHAAISSELVSGEESGQLRSRPVRITGTEYVPPRTKQDIQMEIGRIIYEQEQYDEPLERAVFLHCNIARTQPFIDCNKRTARMVESVAMMNAGLIPCYSSRDADMLHYRRGLIAFYETCDYTQYADYFLDRMLEITNP